MQLHIMKRKIPNVAEKITIKKKKHFYFLFLDEVNNVFEPSQKSIFAALFHTLILSRTTEISNLTRYCFIPYSIPYQLYLDLCQAEAYFSQKKKMFSFHSNRCSILYNFRTSFRTAKNNSF